MIRDLRPTGNRTVAIHQPVSRPIAGLHLHQDSDTTKQRTCPREWVGVAEVGINFNKSSAGDSKAKGRDVRGVAYLRATVRSASIKVL